MYVVIWEFKVKPRCLTEFIELCGHDGEWAKWFRQSPDYIETDLLLSNDQESLFLTIDRWKSKRSYDLFYASDQVTFDRLDQKGENYTLEEKLIGAYTIV